MSPSGGFWTLPRSRPNLWGVRGGGGLTPHIFGGLLGSVKIPLHGDIQALLGLQTSGKICGGQRGGLTPYGIWPFLGGV